MRELLEKNFPSLELAIGYGSGVFPQIGYDYKVSSPMIDLIFVVEDV
jgi:hypothetical protein